VAAKPALSSAVVYRDPMAALKWLEEAFGFETTLLIEDADGNLAHSQMAWGQSLVSVGKGGTHGPRSPARGAGGDRLWLVGNEWTADNRSPASIDGLRPQTVHIQLAEDEGTVDDHCERARKAGAEIIVEPETQFYGDRTYRCKDPEGHIWTVSQTVRVMAPDEWDKAGMGLKTTVYKA